MWILPSTKDKLEIPSRPVLCQFPSNEQYSLIRTLRAFSLPSSFLVFLSSLTFFSLFNLCFNLKNNRKQIKKTFFCVTKIVIFLFFFLCAQGKPLTSHEKMLSCYLISRSRVRSLALSLIASLRSHPVRNSLALARSLSLSHEPKLLRACVCVGC